MREILDFISYVGGLFFGITFFATLFIIIAILINNVVQPRRHRKLHKQIKEYLDDDVQRSL